MPKLGEREQLTAQRAQTSEGGLGKRRVGESQACIAYLTLKQYHGQSHQQKTPDLVTPTRNTNNTPRGVGFSSPLCPSLASTDPRGFFFPLQEKLNSVKG